MRREEEGERTGKRCMDERCGPREGKKEVGGGRERAGRGQEGVSDVCVVESP